ncbi:hypothetical protein [Nitrosopumilus sp.]|uniref:hypothetical protein n=1 Tax=Nitrosopumilus sp. TaxID=2024843 RepID=UPI003D0AAEAC
MKTRLLVITGLVLLLHPAFASSQVFGQIQTIEIRFDEIIDFDGIPIHFSDIDTSRCPVDGECKREQVTVIIKIDRGTSSSTSYMILEKSTSYVKPYEIRVMDIQPWPPHIEKSEYVATLEIAPTPTPEDELACGKGNYLIDGVCHPGKQTGLTNEQQLISNLFYILLAGIGAGINIGLIMLVTSNKRKTKNDNQNESSISSGNFIKEKHLRISAISVVIAFPILIMLYGMVTCTDTRCDPATLFGTVKIYFLGLSGYFLSIGLLAIPLSIVALASGYLTIGTALIHVIPWIILTLVNRYSEKMSILRILYWWIIMTSIAFLAFMIKPFPIAGPL